MPFNRYCISIYFGHFVHCDSLWHIRINNLFKNEHFSGPWYWIELRNYNFESALNWHSIQHSTKSFNNELKNYFDPCDIDHLYVKWLKKLETTEHSMPKTINCNANIWKDMHWKGAQCSSLTLQTINYNFVAIKIITIT